MSALVVGALDGFAPQASTYAAAVDRMVLLAAWFAVFLAVLVAGALALALLAPRESDGVERPRLSPRWVRAGVAGSAALCALVFVHGSIVWADVATAPRGALRVQVAFTERGFAFTYPNGVVTDELHLPIDRPVAFALRANRAPYTFAIPAFRLQAIAASARDGSAWVEANVAGEFEARSTVLASTTDAIPTARVLVHPEGGYDTWYQGISGPSLDLPPIELGRKSYEMRGCTQCHTTDGTKLVGPSFQGFATREHRLVDGTVVVPDEAYVLESITDPAAKVVEGFEPVMPSFKGRFHERELAGLAAYLRSLE